MLYIYILYRQSSTPRKTHRSSKGTRGDITGGRFLLWPDMGAVGTRHQIWPWPRYNIQHIICRLNKVLKLPSTRPKSTGLSSVSLWKIARVVAANPNFQQWNMSCLPPSSSDKLETHLVPVANLRVSVVLLGKSRLQSLVFTSKYRGISGLLADLRVNNYFQSTDDILIPYCPIQHGNFPEASLTSQRTWFRNSSKLEITRARNGRWWPARYFVVWLNTILVLLTKGPYRLNEEMSMHVQLINV